jgi:hypothetical protein
MCVKKYFFFDLRPVHSANGLEKYADDTYLIIPSSVINTTQDEFDNVSDWAFCNNLKLNQFILIELIFHSPRSKFVFPPTLEHIERRDEHIMLGVTITTNFSMCAHVRNVLESCGKILFSAYFAFSWYAS